MRVPDRTGVIVGYRVWRVIPDGWVSPSESLHAHTGHGAWSLTGPTSARCPPRAQADPRKPLLVGGPCGEASPGYKCSCGLYARYEPEGEAYLLPYVAGSVLAWGRVIHHAKRSFFRAEKALPVAFVRPRGGCGLFPEEAEEKLYRVAEELGAAVVEGPRELRDYTEEEASGW
jgi:hypothetical protein